MFDVMGDTYPLHLQKKYVKQIRISKIVTVKNKQKLSTMDSFINSWK